ncbi:hypothetical protein C8R47DRAFT_1150359 [Mycena vitilis]|nr:hypothetical protein C8R47DRAFT_1150359 [Mycena vitilis]
MSTAKLKRHSPTNPKVRARVRKYLAAGASYTTIQQELNISKRTVTRIKNNGYNDTVDEDPSYISEQEVGDSVAAGASATTEAEVIEISSDSELEKDELDKEEEMEGIKLRSMAGPSSISGFAKPQNVADRRPRKAPNMGRMPPGALQYPPLNPRPPTKHDRIVIPRQLAPVQTKGKRARIKNEGSPEISHKRQKRLQEYEPCSDCQKSRSSCDGPQNSSRTCAKSNMECFPHVTAVRVDMPPPSSLSSLGSVSSALDRNAIAGESSFRSNGAGK